MEDFIVMYAKLGRSDKVFDLLKKGISSDTRDIVASILAKNGYTYILEKMLEDYSLDYDLIAMSAAMRGRCSIVDDMIARGCKDYTGIVSGFAYGGYRHLVLKYIGELDSVDVDMVAYTAARRGHPYIIGDMIGMGASDFDYIGHGAIEEGRLDIIMFLMEDIDIHIDIENMHDLAMSYSRMDIVRYLESVMM